VAVRADGVLLRGALALPSGAGPHAAALLLPGSGPLDRDANSRRLPLGVSGDLARSLLGRGIASMRYDKRGVGESQGRWFATGLTDLVADARQVLVWLRSRSEVDAGFVFVVGHSEGALVASALGADPASRTLGGVVLLAPSARTGADTLQWRARRLSDALPRTLERLLSMARLDPVTRQTRHVDRMRATHGDVARVRGRQVNVRWWREILDFDPRAGLAHLDVPVLAVTGSKDLQVDPDDLGAIAETAAGPVDAVRVPDLTHVLRRDPGVPSVAHYRKLLREPTDPELLDTVCDWIAERCRRTGAPVGETS
jgi:uncharacterized protein